MSLDPRLAVLLIIAIVSAILLLGGARLAGSPGATPGASDCGTRNPAGRLRGCPGASEGD